MFDSISGSIWILVRLARCEASYTKPSRLLGRLTEWAADFGFRLWKKWGPSSARWFKLSEFGFRVHLLVPCCIDAPSCQVIAKDLRLSSPPTCRDRSFPASSKKRARRMEKQNENVDSHLGFKFPVKAYRYVGAVLSPFLGNSLIKVSMVSRLQSRRDCLVCEGGALPHSHQGCPMRSRDSISRPRPTAMLFYVRHRTDGRKNNSSTFTMTYTSFPWRRR